ncbi:hypothetical protein DF947_01475 [Pedobacter paludis]|uniref:DUF3945 domain-containing protein n=2 Tax=Pedobacter paludis TaxID=2203212 RepID=A0A317F437_9SPHI|nr:hypothetical protein DF947_01475 [Pedobacter paludis]
MNKNSLENFRIEAKALKIPEGMIKAAEGLMEKGVDKIELFGQLEADRGKLDLTVLMKKSGQSEYYYLNRFELAKSNARPLEKEGHQYLVSGPDENGELKTKRFDSAIQAMDFFKAQKTDFELATGKFSDKDIAFRDVLATMKDGKIDYVQKEFRTTFYSPVIRNAHYVDRGKGFSVEQAANMLQGRAVFRENMVSRAGEEYKAWSQYQFDQPKDRYGNYTMKQYGEGYGFDLKKELSAYPIKELDKKESLEKLVSEMQNGNKPVVTLVSPVSGEELKLRVEAVPRYTNLNFFELGGKPLKREELQKDQGQSQSLMEEKGKNKGKSQQQDNGLNM